MEQARPVTQDLWAYCGICAKWFYISRLADPGLPATCPVCDVASVVFKTAEDSPKHRVSRPTST